MKEKELPMNNHIVKANQAFPVAEVTVYEN